MESSRFQHLRNLPDHHLLGAGTPMCAGCGGLAALHELYDILGEKNVIVNAAGCMTLLAVYPFTPFPGSWLYTAMASAPAGAQGIRDALDILRAQKKLAEQDDLQVMVLTGDGSAYGMGLSATSAAIDRKLDFLYLCYDNEGYGNTGQQYSAATPHGARTATSRGAAGFAGGKKDLFAIWAAHRPPYAATVVAAEPLDLARKVEQAARLSGPRLFIALAPCPTGWDFPPEETMTIGKLAVQTGIWPLREYRDNRISHTKIPRPRLPVEEYLRRQGRFRHLFEPTRQTEIIAAIQREVDRYWRTVEERDG